MNLWLVAGGSVGAIVVGLALAGALEHLAWRLSEEGRRRQASRRRGTVDFRVRF